MTGGSDTVSAGSAVSKDGGSRKHTPRVVLMGTDPGQIKGGIGAAMAGFVEALDRRGLLYRFIPSYDPTSWNGKWVPAVRAALRMPAAIRSIKRSGADPVVYTHAGRWPSLLRESSLLRFAGLFGARTILHVHSRSVDHYLNQPVGRALLRLAFSSADVLYVLTPWWQRRLRDSGVHGNIEVVPNPLPPEMEKAARGERESLPGGSAPGAPIHILTMTRLVPGKGVDLILSALSLLPEGFRLTVAGTGPERDRLADLARSNGVAERVQFVGWVSGEAKRKTFQQADIFCLPSSFDSFGMGLVEAMAYGVPVVALRHGPTPDIVADGKVGFLVDGGAESVAEALRSLGDRELRERMGRHARPWVLKNFGVATVGSKLERLITKHE